MKILFIHGLASSGAYKMASSLRILFRPCTVIAPDVPIDPSEAFAMLSSICEKEQPDLIVGLSLGGFWAQKLHGYRKVLVNPGFHASRLMRTMLGEVKYLAPRANGDVSFEITDSICDAYEALEKTQFDNLPPEEVALTKGLFALEDEMVRCGPEFEMHYPGRAAYYHGRHLPSFPELEANLVPLVRE